MESDLSTDLVIRVILSPDQSSQEICFEDADVTSLCVSHLQLKIQEAFGLEVKHQRLIYLGKVLDSEKVFADAGILGDCCVHLVRSASASHDRQDNPPLSFEFVSFGKTVRVLQDSRVGVGGLVWSSAVVLAKYLENQDDFPCGYFHGKRILEIGSGNGVTSIAVAQLDPAEVIITDLPEQLELIQENVDANRDNCGLTCPISVQPLSWGSDVSCFFPPLDVVIGCDLAYRTELFEPLTQTLCDLTGPNTLVLFCHEWRFVNSELYFFDNLRQKGFEIIQVSDVKFDAGFKTSAHGISMFRMHKNQICAHESENAETSN